MTESNWYRILLVFIACSGAVACAGQKPEAAHASVSDCSTPLAKDAAALRSILDDLLKTYGWRWGGGITRVQQIKSGTYVIELPQDERIDSITYEVKVDDACDVRVHHKAEGTISVE